MKSSVILQEFLCDKQKKKKKDHFIYTFFFFKNKTFHATVLLEEALT